MLEKYNDILSIHDLMEILDIGQNKAYDMVRTGTLYSVRIGRQIRIPKQSLIDFLTNPSYTNDNNKFCDSVSPATKGARQ